MSLGTYRDKIVFIDINADFKKKKTILKLM